MTEPFDRALRAAARRGRSAGVCPDPALLAALVDRSLADDERRRIEAHAADCLACQQHLALLGSVSVDPQDTPARGSWVTRWGWLVPAAAAVVVIGVWTRLPEPDPAAILSDSKVEMTRPVPPAEEPTLPPPAVTPAPGDLSPRAFRDRDTSPRSAAKLDAPRANQGPVRLEPPPARDREAQADERAVASPPADRPLKRQAAGGAAGQGALGKTLPAPRARAAASPPPVPVPPPAAAGKPAPGPGHAAAEARPRELKEEVAAADAAVGAEADAGKAARVAAPQVQASSAERYRASGDAIELSGDGGRTWRRIVRHGSGTFTAAACAGTCWFGTSDGKIFRRVPASDATPDPASGFRVSSSPSPEAVVAIAPEGPEAAAITLASGRRFHTADGGATWTELSRLPANPPDL